MSVLYCRIPDFLIGLTRRARPELKERPLALLRANEQVDAVSPEAWRSGVRREMGPQQALMRCPELVLQSLDEVMCQNEQAAFLDALARWELPVEYHTWGAAYIDLHRLSHECSEVQSLGMELGRRVRALLGQDLQPALGWDSSKFTAQTAAQVTAPGRLRLVGKGEEPCFLQPLSVDLLPLPPETLQWLQWLGIGTLGQFSRLPETAIWQRFGQSARLAQRWAQGIDDRPVRATVGATPQPVGVEFDPPTTLHGAALEMALNALKPHLAALEERLEGCRHLRLVLRFAEGSSRTLDCVFVEPATWGSRLRTVLSARLQALSWPAELSGMHITLLETGELVSRQLTLSPEMDRQGSPLIELAERLGRRYGDVFSRALVVDDSHPLAARRVDFSRLLAM